MLSTSLTRSIRQAVLTFKGKKIILLSVFLRQQYGGRTTIFSNLPGPKSGAQTAAEEHACVSHPFLPPFLRDSHTSSTLLPPAFTARRRNIYQCSKQALHLQSFSLTYLESRHHSNCNKLSNPAPCSQPGGPVGGVGVGQAAAGPFPLPFLPRREKGRRTGGVPFFFPLLYTSDPPPPLSPYIRAMKGERGGGRREKGGEKRFPRSSSPLPFGRLPSWRVNPSPPNSTAPQKEPPEQASHARARIDTEMPRGCGHTQSDIIRPSSSCLCLGGPLFSHPASFEKIAG